MKRSAEVRRFDPLRPRLFTRLGLQLLIVTPLQKIHVIEPHVAAVGFVDNPTATTPGSSASPSPSTVAAASTATVASRSPCRRRRVWGRESVDSSVRSSTQAWTGVEQLVSKLQKRWDTGRYLRAYAADEKWEPITLGVKGPSAADLLDHFDEARKWAAEFERDASVHGTGSERFSLEYRTLQGRNLGVNRIPARMRIDSFEQLCDLLDGPSEIRALDSLLEQTRQRIPSASSWVAGHPLVALNYRDVWDKVLATVEWITTRESRGLYLRQIDVPGVDTKFVEGHRKLLDELLTAVLPPDRIDYSQPRADFTRRFGFLAKPGYTRFRLLVGTCRDSHPVLPS